MRQRLSLGISILVLMIPSGVSRAQILEQPKLRLDEQVDVDGIKVAIKIPEDWNRGWFLFMHGFSPDPTTVPIDEDTQKEQMGTAGRTVITARRMGYGTTRSQHPSTLEGAAEHAEKLRSYLLERFESPGKILIGGSHMGSIISTVIMERYPDDYDGALTLTGVGFPHFFVVIERNFHIRVVFDYLFPGLPGDVYDISERESWGAQDALELMKKADPEKVEAFLRMWDFPSIQEAAIWIWMTARLETLAPPGSRRYDNTNTFYVGSNDDLTLNREIKRYRANVEYSADFGEWNLLTGRIRAPILAVNPTYDLFIPIRSRQHYDKVTLMSGSHDLYVQKWLDWPNQLLPTEVIEKAFGELHRWVTEGIRPEPGEITFDRDAVSVRPRLPGG